MSERPWRHTVAALFTVFMALAALQGSALLFDESPPLPIMALFVALASWCGGVRYGWLALLSIGAASLLIGKMWVPDDTFERIAMYVLLSVALLYGASYVYRIRERESGARDALTLQQTLLRTVIDGIPAQIAYLDAQRRYQLHNRVHAEWFPGAYIDGSHVRDVLGQEAYGRVDALLTRAYAGESAHARIALARAGATRHVDVHFRPHAGPDGDVAGVIALIHDVTDQIRAVEAIQSSEARLRSLAMATASIVWIASPDGELLDPQGWTEFTGRSDVDFAGDGWLDAVHPNDRELLRDVWRRCCLKGDPLIARHRLSSHDRGHRIVRNYAIPIRDDSGTVIEWVGTVQDMDDQFRMETVLKEREHERDALLENAPNMVWIADPHGTVLFNNSRWYDYSGLGPGDHWSEVTHPDDIAPALASWRHSLRTGDPLTVEKRFRRAADGQYRWHLVQGLPIRDAAGRITRWYGSSTDIEDQKRAIATLAEANQRISRFLAVLSHELRNPISGIVTACELLGHAHVEQHRRLAALGVISRHSIHLQRMLDDLLDISRVTEGAIDLKRERCDLQRLLEELLADMRHDAEQRGVSIRLEKAPGVYAVFGDPVRLRQVFTNLISNALKASPQGTCIVVGLSRASAEICEVAVSDQGAGIPPEIRGTVFDAFVQADEWRRAGLGLGLSIVRQLTTLHEGSVRAEEGGHGRGACFVVSLPLLAGVEEDEAAQADTFADAQVEDRQDAPSVLIVDNERENAETLRDLLQLEGYRTDMAFDAESAIARVRQARYDVVLCDIGLDGEFDGLHVARVLRGMEEPPYLVAYSGYGQPRDLKASREAGFDAHLVKPATLAQLLQAIARRHDRTAHPA